MTTENDPVHTVTYFEVAPSAANSIATFLREWQAGTRRSDGCKRMDVLQRSTPKHHFAMVGSWTSRGQYEASRDGAGGNELRAQLGPN
jgi:quinol monooxygenase YgiN